MRRKGALRVQAVNPRSRRLPTPRHCPKRRIQKTVGNTTRLLTNGSTTKTLPQPKDGCIQGGFWYWFDNEGVMAVGLTECAGGRYLLNAGDDASIPYGAMRLGWVACDDGWRFFNASGAMERCWLLDGSNWYWLDPETGIMATGATQCGSSSYCFGASGAMAFGWAYDRGTWYYADSSGELQSGWLHKWGAWYWLDPSTKAMATGLVNDGSNLRHGCVGRHANRLGSCRWRLVSCRRIGRAGCRLVSGWLIVVLARSWNSCDGDW